MENNSNHTIQQDTSTTPPTQKPPDREPPTQQKSAKLPSVDPTRTIYLRLDRKD